MNAEISLLHRHIRPNARDQLPLSDDFSSPLNQRDQRVERATTELEFLVPFLELPLGREQAERTERDDVMHQWTTAVHGHWHGIFTLAAQGCARSPMLPQVLHELARNS